MDDVKKPQKNISSQGDFESIKISVASPEDILSWSYGEVIKPETINYRTQKPEKDGLFAENIFGPSKDWECYCGKYKKIRYRGIVCDKCGVEVTRSVVRRQRMGHISLAVPVTHIWYLRGSPSKLGLLLGLTSRNLEKVVYFAAYIITEVDEEIRKSVLERINSEFGQYQKQIKKEMDKKVEDLTQTKNQTLSQADKNQKNEITKHYDKEITKAKQQAAKKADELKNTFNRALEEVSKFEANQIISESKYRTISLRYGQIIKASIGAEAILDLLARIDINKTIIEIDSELSSASTQRRRKLLKKMRLLKNLSKSGIRPEWMVLKELPVIPPDLRPMVQLDGGRFASSDLNDLYRRVINRNNRLKKLIDLGAPEIICRNEKRMLQEAIDALIDNTPRRGKSAVLTSNRRKYKSLSDMLKGKQGRFRQNLLGKRVDYSGRSVIAVGPDLKLNQCGLPKKIALELFKPYVIHGLIEKGYAHNIKNAGKIIERKSPEIWDILEEYVNKSHVLLNRAPTLHRLGIQAFQPVLIEGKAIQIHPLVCPAYNADFDGDQMAVHLPLSGNAQTEARNIMCSSNNLLKPADGEPIVAPAQDIVLGCYYLTAHIPGKAGEGKAMSSVNEAVIAYTKGVLDLHSMTKIKIDDQIVETTLGRIIFNSILPPELGFKNETFVKGSLEALISECFNAVGIERTAVFADEVKQLGFFYATRSGITFCVDDIQIPEEKAEYIKDADVKIANALDQFYLGLITRQEYRRTMIESWLEAINRLNDALKGKMDPRNPLHACIISKARGNISQYGQIAGLKGLVSNPAGDIIELPVKSNFSEGLTELEYFISTHGSRKGKTDTALKTADAGYLTRRLVDVGQDIITTTVDCGTTNGIVFHRADWEKDPHEFTRKIVGRYPAEDIKEPGSKTVLASADDLLDLATAKAILDNPKITEIKFRSTLYCENVWGICTKCYGVDLGRGHLVSMGVAVGIVAAQSIGEPATQLTMRTFHTGGVASAADITQGLPRVEELFEARVPSSAAILSDLTGKVSISEKNNNLVITVTSKNIPEEVYHFPKEGSLRVEKGENVTDNQLLVVLPDQSEIRAQYRGEVMLDGHKITIKHPLKISKDFIIPPNYSLLVQDGDDIERGNPLTEGHYNLSELLKYKDDLAVKKYIIAEIQKTYMFVGSSIHDKHLEIVVRMMFSKVRITDPQDSEYLPREIVDKNEINKVNAKLIKANLKPALSEPIVMGITKVSLKTESFLSAASFQETTSVLMNAALQGKVDLLRGLKENTIIGKLIPVGTGYSEERYAKIIKEASK